MLTRVLELWDQVPQASELIDADHVLVLERTVALAHVMGEDERGLGFVNAALREIDADAHPARAALLLERRGTLRKGSPSGIDDLHEALRLVAGPSTTRSGPRYLPAWRRTWPGARTGSRRARRRRRRWPCPGGPVTWRRSPAHC